MAAGLVGRALDALELLATHSPGVALQTVADRLAIPKSGAHRLLAELVQEGYVAQEAGTSRYLLTTKLAALGLRHLASTGFVDVAQSILNQLAAASGELVRMAVVDHSRLVWVAKAQGARSGLRFDGEMGTEVPLSSTANGHAWLASFSDEDALKVFARQSFDHGGETGPKAPRTVKALLACLEATRERGYAWTFETTAAGTAGMACVIRHPTRKRVLGTVSIFGPSARLTEAQRDALAPELLNTAAHLSATSPLSEYLSALGVEPA